MLEARAQTIEQNRERRGKRICVGVWSIYRSDENNIVLQKNEDDPLYYPDVGSAMVGLYRRMIEPDKKMELSAHRVYVGQVEARIMTAIAGVKDLFDAA